MKKRIYKSSTNKVISGVIGGIGEYMEVDPTILRLMYILIAILTAVFPAVVGYFIASMIVPSRPITMNEEVKEPAKEEPPKEHHEHH